MSTPVQTTTESPPPQSAEPVGLRPVSPMTTVLLAALALLAGSAVTMGLDAITVNRCHAVLQAHATTVWATRHAIVAEIRPRVGDTVTNGEQILTLRDESLEAQIVAKERELSECVAECNRANAEAEIELIWRRRELRQTVFETRLKSAELLQDLFAKQVEHVAWKEHVKSLEATTSLVSLHVDAKSALFDRRLPDEDRLRALLNQDSAASACEAISVQVQLCDQRLTDLEGLEKELGDRVKVARGVTVAEVRKVRVEQELESLKVQRDGMHVVCGSFGKVVQIHCQPQTPIQPGEPLMEIIDPDRRYLTAVIPSRSMAGLSKGERLTVVFPGKQRREGLVADIPLRSAGNTAISETDAPIEVRIEPCGREWPSFPAGTRVDVQLPE